MRVVKENYTGPVSDGLTWILSRFLKTVPAADRQESEDPNGHVMSKEKLDEAVRRDPEFQHLIDVGALWHV